MAKKRSKSRWENESPDGLIDSMFSTLATRAADELGTVVHRTGQVGEHLVGLPLPSLALQYLFQSNILPLSRIIQITGQEGCCKSGLAYEIIRWHMDYGGGGVLAENENKDSCELRHGIFKWKQEYMDRLLVVPTHYLEEWQAVFTKFIELFKAECDSSTGLGRALPVCFLCDSIMATAPREELNTVLKDGFASRGHPLAANLIARYMRTMPDRIRDYPFTIVGTNHLKPGTDMRGLPTSNIPGGKAVKFMETYELKMAKVPRGAHIDKAEYGGLRVSMQMEKNSLGPSKRQIEAEMIWWYEDSPEGGYRQQFLWDWHSATVDMLFKFETMPGKKTLFNNLRDVTGIRPASKSRRMAYSDVLGIPKDDPQPYRVVGEALHNNPEALAAAQRLLGVAIRHVYQPGLDYLEQLKAAASSGDGDDGDG